MLLTADCTSASALILPQSRFSAAGESACTPHPVVTAQVATRASSPSAERQRTRLECVEATMPIHSEAATQAVLAGHPRPVGAGEDGGARGRGAVLGVVEINLPAAPGVGAPCSKQTKP